MTRTNRLRGIFSTASLIGSLFLASCSQEPASGPLSPLNSASKRPSIKPQTAANTVRPLKRLDKNTRASLAKRGYTQEFVVEQLQTVSEELKSITANNYGMSKVNAAVQELNSAIKNLGGSSSGYKDDEEEDDEGEDDDDKAGNDEKALKDIAKAKTKLDDAVKKSELLAAQGEQFKNQLAAVEDQINTGASPSSDLRGQRKELLIRRAHGGLIKFGGHSIKVPKYATKQDEEFSISISANDYITVDFGPDGWFEQQVTVTISYEDVDLTSVDPSKLTLAWFDETTGQWVDLGGVVDLIKKTVTAKAWHFTQYTISTK